MNGRHNNRGHQIRAVRGKEDDVQTVPIALHPTLQPPLGVCSVMIQQDYFCSHSCSFDANYRFQFLSKRSEQYATLVTACFSKIRSLNTLWRVVEQRCKPAPRLFVLGFKLANGGALCYAYSNCPSGNAKCCTSSAFISCF